MVRTFSNNKWHVYGFYIDLYRGTENLGSVIDDTHISTLKVKYEDTVLENKN
jgi:hypothetical protein